MPKSFSKYQTVILRDVGSADYEKHERLIWKVFYSVGAFGFLVYAVLLFHVVGPFVGRFMSLFSTYTYQTDENIHTVLYLHEGAVVLLGFFVAVLVFAMLGFFVFDIQQRNEVIRRLRSEGNGLS